MPARSTMSSYHHRTRSQSTSQEDRANVDPCHACCPAGFRLYSLCKAMEERWDSLWLFCYQDGVEPTNNGSERRIRKGVQWRKKSLGTRSADGAAFALRMLTVTDTCRPQGRSPLTYLTEAAEPLRSGTPAPSLLPEVPEPLTKDQSSANLR